MTKFCLRLATFLAAVLLGPGLAFSQSRTSSEMFNEQDVVHGISISRAACRRLELGETAVWVMVGGKGYCLRYYAFGLKSGSQGNPLVAAWLHGDVVGDSHPKHAGHQEGLGVNAMIAQERYLSERYNVPFVFLARPGAYGSAGYHPKTASTKLEADLVAAQITAISLRYGVRSWVLGGHSGGGTLVGEMLARRRDIRCAVISSGAPAYNAYLEAHDVAWRIRRSNLNAIDDVHKISPENLKVIVMGDPRDKNVYWSVQAIYYQALKSQGVDATLIPLERGRPDEFHSLVDLGEAATGLCADGAPVTEIHARLEAMPSQGPRISN